WQNNNTDTPCTGRAETFTIYYGNSDHLASHKFRLINTRSKCSVFIIISTRLAS
ncbi:MAG: hypothetical protein ACI8RD_010024, partial [Bacillariaceae sp.]